jgi:YidC/Oxa1 family membrane protein insertase
MDRKAIIVLAASFLLLIAWVPLGKIIWGTTPGVPVASNVLERVAGNTNQPAATNPPVVPTLSAAPTNVPPPAPKPTQPEQVQKIAFQGTTYFFTSHGGGLKEVELDGKKYPAIIGHKGETNLMGGAVLNRGASRPILALGGHASLVEDGFYQLTPVPGGVRMEKTLTNGLHIVKEFHPTSNYLVTASIRIENRSGQPVLAPSQEYLAGTASLVHAKEDPMQLGAFFYDGDRLTHVDEPWFANRTLGCLPGTPREMFRATEKPTIWAASHNRFFAVAAVPAVAAPEARAYKVPLDLIDPNPAKRTGIEAVLVYPGKMLASGEAITNQFSVFAGPKDYDDLALLGDRMKNNLDYLMKFNGFFGWFSKVLLISMKGLHDFLKLPYGLAIIAITVIIKLVFWPLTRASTRSMKRMAALQPEMNKIREKYKDDAAKMNKKMMEFMKENKVSPLGGCLPMLIQIPVFFGFYYMIQSAIELRGASFLWAWDLSVPDTVATLAGFAVNPLPIVMGVTMFYQARLTPPSPGMDPTQQKMMQYMPLIFLFVLYNMSSGLTLYWTVQNVLTIVQTKLTKTEPAKALAVAAAAPVRRK